MLEKSKNSININYQAIISIARQKAKELKSQLPKLPINENLIQFKEIMHAEDKELIVAIHLNLKQTGKAKDRFNTDHNEKVAILSAYVASMECNFQNISEQRKRDIVKRTWRIGLLHDIERWRGWDSEHQIRGYETADSRMLPQLGIKDDYITRAILLHDQLTVDPTGNPDFDIPFSSVFASDHYLWGLLWEEERWQYLESQNIPVSNAIHDYDFMKRLTDSPNLKQTTWGKEVALPYVQYGLEIAKHIEDYFSG